MFTFLICRHEAMENHKRKALMFIVAVNILFLVACGMTVGQTDFNDNDVVEELVKNLPDGLTCFSFDGHDKEAQLLNHYLWYHLYNRYMLNQQVIYNREYTAISDTWVANAVIKDFSMLAQQEQRQSLLAMPIDNEVYN